MYTYGPVAAAVTGVDQALARAAAEVRRLTDGPLPDWFAELQHKAGALQSEAIEAVGGAETTEAMHHYGIAACAHERCTYAPCQAARRQR